MGICASSSDSGTSPSAGFRLVYFDIRFRAETSRIMFALSGIPYEDKRVQQSEWAELKPSKFMHLNCFLGIECNYCK